MQWMKDNLEFSDKTAQNYMKVYTNQDSLKNETVSFLREAYQSLIEHKPEKRADKTEETVEAEVVPAPEGKRFHHSLFIFEHHILSRMPFINAWMGSGREFTSLTRKYRAKSG